MLHTLQCVHYIENFLFATLWTKINWHHVSCVAAAAPDVRFDDMCPLHWNFHDFRRFIGRLRLSTIVAPPSWQPYSAWKIIAKREMYGVFPLVACCSLLFRISSFSSFDGLRQKPRTTTICLPKTDDESSSINCSRQAHSLTGWFSPMALRVCVLCGVPMELKRWR